MPCRGSRQLFVQRGRPILPLNVSSQNNEMGNLKTQNPKKRQTFQKELPFPSFVICFEAGNRISKPLCSLFSTCSESKGHETDCELPSHFSQHPLSSLPNSQQSPRLINQTVFCTYFAFLSNQDNQISPLILYVYNRSRCIAFPTMISQKCVVCRS